MSEFNASSLKTESTFFCMHNYIANRLTVGLFLLLHSNEIFYRRVHLFIFYGLF